MNMKLLTRISNINGHLGSIDGCKVSLANELFDAKKNVYWQETSYGSWKVFCDKNVSLSQSAIYVYLKTAELARDNKFSPAEMKILVDSIGWERLKIGLTKVAKNETISWQTFISRYFDLNLNERVTYEDTESELVTFAFHIPQDAADTLTNALLARGMRIVNKSRSNLSSAMVKLIDDLVDDE